MFKVIVVDDEPTALQHICSIIRLKCPEYEIVETAEDGVEAMKKIGVINPDLVISDVKMPNLNGIELAKQIRETFPKILVIIVSGYQDFEYAKGAIQSGVYDYILKPVLPSNMQGVLQKAFANLNMNFYKERNRILHKIYRGKEIEKMNLSKYFPHKKYFCAIIRYNGLPRRFSIGNDVEVYSDINESITIFGRDEMEGLYIIPQELLFNQTVETFMKRVRERGKKEKQYTTIVYSRKSVSSKQLQEQIKSLYKILDTATVTGKNQMIDMNQMGERQEIEFDYSSIKEVLSKTEYLLNEQKYENLKKELKRLYLIWKKEEKPQLWVEHISREIAYLARKNNQGSSHLIECEYMLEDAFFYATSMEELVEMLFEVMFKFVKEEALYFKVDTPEFFKSIKEYLHMHLASSITLQSICRQFGISQTYLSKLFRKYENQSFNHYLTMIRMDKARALIKEDTEIFVKEVAARVGYDDQFYFSRIFSSYVGKCPSEYMEELIENRKEDVSIKY